MAALTAASWTIAITDRNIHQKERVVRGTALLAGTDTYPAGGVPLPAAGILGMVRNLESLVFFGQDSAPVTQYKHSFDKGNNKMQFYEEEAAAAGGPLLECDTAEVPGPRTYRFEAKGW